MEPLEVVDLFLDGERVDVAELKHALSSDEGRQYLVDVLALRQLTGVGAPPALDARPRERSGRASRWLAFAAAIVVSVGAGFLAGQTRTRPAVADQMPAAAVAVEPAAPIIPSAPVPTSVIRLEPGVDWNESGG